MPQQQELNPYAAPKAPVSDAGSPATASTVFFPVGTLKLAVMSLVTLNVYQIYWYYSHWRHVKARERIKINPVLRAIFYPFFVYPLFNKIRQKCGEVGMEASYSPGLLTVVVVLLTIAGQLPDPAWLVSLLLFVPLLPVQSAVNRIHSQVAPDADPNIRFSGWNIFGIVLGVLLWIIILIGLFVPIEGS